MEKESEVHQGCIQSLILTDDVWVFKIDETVVWRYNGTATVSKVAPH